MSRYKKASYNEYELEEIDGITPMLRPTRDEKMLLLETFMKQQKDKTLNLSDARKVLKEILYNSLFLWEGGKRTNKKEEGSEEITIDDIDDFVTNHIFELWLNVLHGLDIIDKKKLEDLQKKQAEKAEAEALKDNPN